MSPASRSKSKDKKAVKDAQKASSKPSGAPNANSGIPASAYNPLLGTFHTLESVPTSSATPLQSNGRFRNIDETEEHLGGSLGAGVEYDAVSNNGSWSGESEDHKEKASNTPVRLETIPGADNDKREKIRQKNERKHQRQKERRAQELHERCSGYLMSRKLEALAQQLVAMGFSQERATMALILNEGKVEESVAWLFEGNEEADEHRDPTLGGGNLKIDISEELARIADVEIRYKCTKQEVERAVVTAEGDLEKAAENLRALRQDPPSAPPKPEETGDPPIAINGKSLVVPSSQNSAVRPQPKSNQSPTVQQRKDERDFNYAKTAATLGPSSESVNKSVQPLKKIQPKLEWVKPQQQTSMLADKRWPGGSNPSVSYSLASPLQAVPPPAKPETRYIALGSEFKNLQQPSVREPVIMMQRAQPVNTKQIPVTSISSSPPGTATSWYPTNSVEIMRSNGFMPHIPSSRSLSPNNLTSYYQQVHYQHQQHFAPNSSSGESPGTSRGNGQWSRNNAAPTLAAASSLGLFSGLGSTGSSGASSPVDWSTGGSMAQLDYTSIDWSLNRSLTSPGKIDWGLDRGLTSPRPTGLWIGSAPSVKNTTVCDSNINGLGAKPAMRPAPLNSGGVPIVGLQDGGVTTAESSTSSSSSSVVGSREWTSPFEGKDLFSVPRQFVSSPSL